MLLASSIFTASLTNRSNRSHRLLEQAKSRQLAKGYAAQGSAIN